MRALAGLFGKSPFFPLQKHMEKVSDTIDKMAELFPLVKNKKWELVESKAKEVSKLEHLADLTKNEIRNQVPKNLILPIDGEVLLNMLSLQEFIADTAEDVAVLFSIKQTEISENLFSEFEDFLKANLKSFNNAHKIIQELHELFQSSFGGIEAESVKSMAEDVAYQEHQCDLMQRKILKKLFNLENELSYTCFHLWIKILESVAKISDLSEKLANCIPLTLERR